LPFLPLLLPLPPLRWNYAALSKNEFSLLVAIFTFHRTKAKYLAVATTTTTTTTAARESNNKNRTMSSKDTNGNKELKAGKHEALSELRLQRIWKRKRDEREDKPQNTQRR